MQAEFEASLTDSVQGIRVGVIERQCLFVRLDRVTESAGPVIRVPQLVPSERLVRVDVDGVVEGGDLLFHIAFTTGTGNPSKSVPCAGVLRVEIERTSIGIVGFLQRAP